MAKKLGPQEALAQRLREAMNDSEVSASQLCEECGVSVQAVHGWRTTGRIAKHHLTTIARVTGKSLEFFLDDLRAA